MGSPADIEQWRKASAQRFRQSVWRSRKRSAAGGSASITRSLTEAFPILQWMMVSFCWPLQGEFDRDVFIGTVSLLKVEV